MSLDIFFSHGSADREWVQHITGSIENDDLHVYLFERDVRPGHSITEKVQHAIAACDIVIVLLTRRSRASAYVQQEIGFAEGKGKLVIPLVEKGIPARSLAMLAGREYVPFDTKAIDGCVAALTYYLMKQVESRSDKTLAGLTRDQWIAIMVGLAVIALGLCLVYAVTKD